MVGSKTKSREIKKRRRWETVEVENRAGIEGC